MSTSRQSYPSDGHEICSGGATATAQYKGQCQGQGQSQNPIPPLIWLESVDLVCTEAKDMMEKLHDIRTKYRPLRDKNWSTYVQDGHRLLSDLNEELLTLCSENRRRYKPDVGERTLKIEKERQEEQKLIRHYETKILKLEKDLKEAIQAKEHALNRLSDLQSRMLKFGNPEISDLSDENRPTNLGQSFKQLYEDEWTDAFEFLTEKRLDEDSRFKDGEAIDMLYDMLKRCNDVCSDALKGQQTALAQLVSNPPYLKSLAAPIVSQSKSDVQPRQTSNVAQKLNVTVKPVYQMSSGEQNVNFARSVPAKHSKGKATQDQGLQDQHIQGQMDQNLNGLSSQLSGNRTYVLNKNAVSGHPKSAQQPDVYEAKPLTESTKSTTDGQVIAVKLDVPFKEFSKSVASEVLRNLSVSDVVQTINRDKRFQDDVIRNGDVQKYVEKCFHLCWLMLVQYPPMVMDFDMTPGRPLDTDVFDIYVNRGPKIGLVVWPPVYLHKGGPLVCKGYADGMK